MSYTVFFFIKLTICTWYLISGKENFTTGFFPMHSHVDNEFKSYTNDEYQILTDANDTTIRGHKHHGKTKQDELLRIT